MMNGSLESSNGGAESGNNAKAPADGGLQSGKGTAAAATYSGVVAQRALYGSYKRRVGRRIPGKTVPSRLSKVSAADNNDSWCLLRFSYFVSM